MLNKMTRMALAGALILGTASTALAAGNHAKGANAANAYGFANGEPTNGTFVNGNFIPRGTSPAQVPSHHEEDKYGSGMDK
jgi:hypothetical protein